MFRVVLVKLRLEGQRGVGEWVLHEEAADGGVVLAISLVCRV